MTTHWTVKDANGEFLAHFTSASPLEVARKVVPTHYDAFRLHVSSSYRDLFERAARQILDGEVRQIVRVKGTVRAARIEERPAHAFPSDGLGNDCTTACE